MESGGPPKENNPTGSISKDQENRTVQVCCLRGLNLDTGQLILYFQNRKRSGGGPVEDLVQQHGKYLLVFEREQDAANVLGRQHDLNGVPLAVYSYNPPDPLYQDAFSPTSALQDPTYRNIASDDWDIYLVPEHSSEIRITSGKQRYLQKYLVEDVDGIRKKYLTGLEYSDGMIVLSGKGDTLHVGVGEFNDLLWKISEDNFPIAMPRVLDFLRSDTGMERIERIEESLKCTIDVEEGLYAYIDRDCEISDKGIKLIYGTMATEQADVLVNTVSTDLNLSAGSISSSMLEIGGGDLQRQCNVKYPSGIQYAEVAKTSGGRLKCKEVYHCCLPEWSGEGNMQDLQTVLYNCLQEASQSGYRSIVLPAFGTGVLKYPPNLVARFMFAEIDSFFTYKTSLQQVAIVLYRQDVKTVECFEREYDAAPTTHGHVQMRRKNVQVTKNVIKIGDMSVRIKQGDITQEDTDCIVNSTNLDMDLMRGALSMAIRKACGDKLDGECKQKVPEMKRKGIAVTTAPHLPSKFIIHVAFEHFHGNWKEIIKSCLKTAHDRSLSSIAFPPLGTGGGSLPMETMTKILISSLREFGLKTSTVKEIRIVIFEQDKQEKFLAKLEEIIQHTEKEKRISQLLKRKSKIKMVKEERGTDSETASADDPQSENRSGVVDDIVMCSVSSTGEEAEISIYSEEPENRPLAFQQIQDFCHQHIFQISFECQKIKILTKEQLHILKDFLKDMNLNIVVHPKTGTVDVEGLRDDVLGLESLLTNMVDNLAPG